MSIQSTLNNIALKMLPKTWAAIQSAEQFEHDQMTDRALREILNSHVPLDDMTKEAISIFDSHLIAVFQLYNLVK